MESLGGANSGTGREEQIWKPSIFGIEMSCREVNPYKTQTPSLSSLIELSKITISTIFATEPSMEKQIVREGFHYYVGCIAWLRMIDLKRKRPAALTEQEKKIDELLRNVQLNIPEPIFLYMKSLGKINIICGGHFSPEFADLPVQVQNNNGGYFGPVDENTHNLYEEIPCLGVLAEGLRHSISNEPHGHRYRSSIAPSGLDMNDNLLGYEPLLYRREEAKSTILALGITPELMPDSVVNTGFNVDVIIKMSSILGTSETFNNRTTIRDIDETGSPSQSVISHPTELAQPVRNVMSETFCTSVALEAGRTYGVAHICGFQRMKSQTTYYANESLNSRSWCCVSYTGDTPETTIPEDWVINRNIRRQKQFLAQVFRTISLNSNQEREDMVNRLHK